VKIANESSLAATRRLGGDIACLVFASARNPGGGFLNGAQARGVAGPRFRPIPRACAQPGSSTATIESIRTLTYSDRAIYSPAVPVFRDDHGVLLPAPYPVSFLIAAAPNRVAILRNQPEHASGAEVVSAIPGSCRSRRRSVADPLHKDNWSSPSPGA
jgi:uncharacterized protein (TIGR02452 family)